MKVELLPEQDQSVWKRRDYPTTTAAATADSYNNLFSENDVNPFLEADGFLVVKNHNQQSIFALVISNPGHQPEIKSQLTKQPTSYCTKPKDKCKLGFASET